MFLSGNPISSWKPLCLEHSENKAWGCWFIYSKVTMVEASLMAQTVKNLPAMQETWFWSLGQEDSLERGMATHSRILTWRIPWTDEPARATAHGVAKIWTQLSHQHTRMVSVECGRKRSGKFHVGQVKVLLSKKIIFLMSEMGLSRYCRHCPPFLKWTKSSTKC